jgi:drug/metabolite transporter (DMT)-like permease
VATGLGWAFTGVLLSYCARRQVATVTLLGPMNLLGLLIVFTVLPDYGRLRGGLLAGEWALAGVMLAAGMINAWGLLTLQRAMRRGHHGVTWAIGQSAMVVPFLVGVLVFGDAPGAWRLVGFAAILVSLFVLGRAEAEPDAATERQAGSGWMLQALSALALLGVGQVLSALPSYLPALADGARLRLPMFLLGNGSVMVVLWGRHGGRPDRRTLALALIGCVTGLAATLAMFRGLDLLAAVRLGALGFPIAVGTCIVGFATYSAAVLREPLTRERAMGLLLGLAGVVLLAIS